MLNRAYNALWAVTLLLCAVLALEVATALGAFDPKPYWGVHQRSVLVRPDGDVEFVADFTKGQCTRVHIGEGGFVIRGHILGRTDVLRFSDLDGRPEDEDRVAGDTTLRTLIHTNGTAYSTIEIWTRHICDGKKVDRMFARIDL